MQWVKMHYSYTVLLFVEFVEFVETVDTCYVSFPLLL